MAQFRLGTFKANDFGLHDHISRSPEMLARVTSTCFWCVRLTKENIPPNIWPWLHAKPLTGIVWSDLHNSGRCGLIWAPFSDGKLTGYIICPSESGTGDSNSGLMTPKPGMLPLLLSNRKPGETQSIDAHVLERLRKGLITNRVMNVEQSDPMLSHLPPSFCTRSAVMSRIWNVS